MKRRFIAVTVALFAAQTTFIAPVRAQVKEWNPTCAQMLALGYERYAEEYEKRTNDYSTMGNVQKSARYSECKNAANLCALQTLPAARRARALKAQEHLATWENALWSIEMMSNGNGTMYASFAAYSRGTGSDMLGIFIAAMLRAKRSPLARKSANAQWDAANQSFARWDKMSAQNFASSDDLKQSRAEYKIVRPLAQRELKSLQTLAAQLPDEAALILAQRCTKTVTQIEKEDL